MSAVWDTDYLWREVQGAKLAFLFGADQAECQGNESFQFVAPKQPKKTFSKLAPPLQKSDPSPGTPSILLAIAVHAFRFVNGQYVKQGKLGAAILGTHATKEYKVLLYGSQQKQITTAQIHPGFVLTVQSVNYATFYDDQRQTWSLKFDSEKAAIDFCREVCLARWNSEPLTGTLMIQDLLQGEGQVIDVGDIVEVAFTCCLLKDYTFSQQVDYRKTWLSVLQTFGSTTGKDNLQRVRLGPGKSVTAWEDGLLGMQKGGRRLLIIPPSLAQGSTGIPDRVPPSSTLVFDIKVHRVKFSKDGECQSGGSMCPTSPGPSLDTVITAQSAIFGSSEHGTEASQVMSGPEGDLPKHTDAVKAKLISRMAKMGQPLLPFLKGATAAQSDRPDSEMEDASESRPVCETITPVDSSSSSQPLLNTSTNTSYTVNSKPVVVTQPEAATAEILQQVHVISDGAFQLCPTSQMQPLGTVFPPQHQLYQAADINSFLMTEARNNTEIRMAVGRLSDKLDQLASKMDVIQRQGTSSFSLSTMSLETAMILHNIQRITQENVTLKQEVVEKASRVEEQNRKIGELIEQNQKCTEQSELGQEQRSHAVQSLSELGHARLLHAEQEKVRLAVELDSSTSLVCELQQEVDCLQQRATELQAKLSAALQDGQSRNSVISTMETQMEELKNEGEQFQQQLKAERRKVKRMELTVKNLEEELQDLRTEKENLEQVLRDRRKWWQMERENILMVQEEQRRSSEQENQQLLQQLRQAKACNETHIRQQTELECKWQKRCDAALEQQRRTMDAAFARLQEQYVTLQKKVMSQKQQLEAQAAVQVKKVMNGLFHSLKAEFDLQETYTGNSVLQILLRTIRHVTMKLLGEPKEPSSEAEEDADDEEYLSTEETGSKEKEGKMEDDETTGEKEDSLQMSLDQTYMTAVETVSLETSAVSSDFLEIQALDEQPMETHRDDVKDEDSEGVQSQPENIQQSV